MTGAPRSKQFDDVYFSAQNGLEETRHVFIDGNSLPARWLNRPEFTIFETGFGTGLNFLVAGQLFADTAANNQKLHFISVEKFPLSCAEIEQALAHWKNEFKNIWSEFLKFYPEDKTGSYTLQITPSIKLTLIFGDVNEILPALNYKIDAWFLDGFKPASNPDMWSETVFKNMARLSQPGASFATFTAAGFVKRGLKAAGFTVEKARGYGTKRDMLIGRIS